VAREERLVPLRPTGFIEKEEMMELMYLINLFHCTAYFRHSPTLAMFHILQNFLRDTLFKMSSARTVVTLQSGNMLQITSGNGYAV